jgi:CRP-like cAMP-binding protein
MPKHPMIERLAAQPLLRGMHERDLLQLVQHFDQVSFEPGSVLMAEGHAGLETFLIESGEVSVTIEGCEVNRVGAGGVIGEMAVLDRAPRSATVTAVTDVEAFVLSVRAFRSLADRATVGARLAAVIAARLRAAEPQR